MLTVLHVLSPMPMGETGGADRHVADLARQQAGTGLIRPVIFELGAKGYGEFLRRLGVPAVTEMRPYSLGAAVRLAQAIDQHAVDVVHSHGYDADQLSALVAGACHTPSRPRFVATTHGFITGHVRNALRTHLNLQCLRLFDGAIATSTAAARLLEATLPHCRVHLVFNGVEAPSVRAVHEARATARLEMGFAEPCPVVGFCGRLSPEKRPDLFLQACARLASVDERARFVVMGSGSEELPLRVLAGSRLGSRLRFMGHVERADQMISGLDALICCSDTEGTPRVVLEAMARRVAVVATAVGGLHDIVTSGEDGVLVRPGSAVGLARAAEAVLKDDEWRGRMVARARATVEYRFTLEAMERQVAAVYTAPRNGGSPAVQRRTKNIRSAP